MQRVPLAKIDLPSEEILQPIEQARQREKRGMGIGLELNKHIHIASVPVSKKQQGLLSTKRRKSNLSTP